MGVVLFRVEERSVLGVGFGRCLVYVCCVETLLSLLRRYFGDD